MIDTKYKMMFAGEWRAVTNMFDGANNETTLAIRAVKVVLHIDDDRWAAVAVSPGDLIERFDRNPDDRAWDIC
jgi:hypothetical protein